MESNKPAKVVLFDGSIKDATHEDTIYFMREYAEQFAREDWAKQLAFEFLQSANPVKAIFDYVYSIGVFKNDYSDQYIKSHNRAKADGTLNCVQYSVIIGSLLTAIDEPFYFRAVDIDGGGFSHIYVKTTKGVTLDATLGQPTNDKATFENRPPAGQFNVEYPYLYKLDTMGKSVILLNGRRSSSRNLNACGSKPLNGVWCSILHPFNAEKRSQCDWNQFVTRTEKDDSKEAAALQASADQIIKNISSSRYPSTTGTTGTPTQEKKGILAALDGLFGNMQLGCEQSCNLFHPFNENVRNSCLTKCAPTTPTQPISGGSTLAGFVQDNGLLLVIGGAMLATYIEKKSTKRKKRKR